MKLKRLMNRTIGGPVELIALLALIGGLYYAVNYMGIQ